MVRAVLARRDHMATQAARYELTLQQAHLLQLLEDGPARTMTTIARALTCDASNVTGIVDRLEARRLIVRRSAKHDRRIKTLALTPQGAALISELRDRMLDPPGGFRRLRAPELATLQSLVRRAIGLAHARTRAASVDRSTRSAKSR